MGTVGPSGDAEVAEPYVHLGVPTDGAGAGLSRSADAAAGAPRGPPPSAPAPGPPPAPAPAPAPATVPVSTAPSGPAPEPAASLRSGSSLRAGTCACTGACACARRSGRGRGVACGGRTEPPDGRGCGTATRRAHGRSGARCRCASRCRTGGRARRAERLAARCRGAAPEDRRPGGPASRCAACRSAPDRGGTGARALSPVASGCRAAAPHAPAGSSRPRETVRPRHERPRPCPRRRGAVRSSRIYRSGSSSRSPRRSLQRPSRRVVAEAYLSLAPMRFYVTTPIYYVNDKPHIGHAYTTIAADILARHHRQRGEETFFLTGVDEHATKVWRVAEKPGPRRSGVRRPDRRGLAQPAAAAERRDGLLRPHERRGPQDVRARVPAAHLRQRRRLRGRLRRPLLRRLRGVQDGGRARRRQVPAARHRPRMDRGEELLLPALGATRTSCSSSTTSGRTSSSRRSGSTRCGASCRAASATSRSAAPASRGASRCRGTRAQVAYVWADALVNYLSALTYARPGEDLRDAFWPEVRHLMAQDILRFHCVYWPAMLLSAGYTVPKQIFIHGYLLLDDLKISKSLGNAVDPLELIDLYGADALRFWCARAVLVRPGRERVARRHRRPLRARARQRPRQPALADDGDDRPLPRRRDSRRACAPDRSSRTRSPTCATTCPRDLDAFDITGASTGSGCSSDSSTVT